jgi:hypothetical protein
MNESNESAGSWDTSCAQEEKSRTHHVFANLDRDRDPREKGCGRGEVSSSNVSLLHGDWSEETDGWSLFFCLRSVLKFWKFRAKSREGVSWVSFFWFVTNRTRLTH